MWNKRLTGDANIDILWKNRMTIMKVGEKTKNLLNLLK